MKNNVMYRQGDVLLVRVSELPEGKKSSEIIAQGEFSNHSHIITGDAEVIESEGGDLYVNATNASIEHLLETAWKEGRKEWTKEHEAIQIDPGFYKVVLQRQYNPYEKAIQRVRD